MGHIHDFALGGWLILVVFIRYDILFLWQYVFFAMPVQDGNWVCNYYQGKVLEPLGAITSGSQFLEPDGTVLNPIFAIKKSTSFLILWKKYIYSGLFPNHIPNPEDKAAMKSITEAVLSNRADLGIDLLW